MNNKLFYRLSLPDNPLINVEKFVEHRKKQTGYSFHFKPEEVLTNEFLNAFKSVGVTPGYIVVFSNSYSGTTENRWVHTDVVSEQDPRTLTDLKSVRWKFCNCGINFEIFDNENIFNWYKPFRSIRPLLPDIKETTPLHTAWLSGIHYHDVRNIGGVPKEFKLIESTPIRNQPVLLRTDVAHSTTFNMPSNSSHRMAVSIRFYENWSWEKTVEIFSPLFSE